MRSRRSSRSVSSCDRCCWQPSDRALGQVVNLIEKDVVAVGADTWGLETVPFEKDVGVFEIHQWLIPKNGIYILENIDTRELVKDKAWEFLFVLGPARLRGAVQMIINPIAIR